MAELLNSTQQAQLRADGHKAKFYLSVAKPVTVLSCQVNNVAITRGATAIAVDNGTAASLSAVKAGMTLAVTTATGVQWVRIVAVSLAGTSPTISGTITVDTNPILWGDNQAIVVYSMYEPWAIMPTFDAGTGISTKRGQTFAGQTATPGPVARGGPHRVGFVDGSLVFSLSGSGDVMTPGASISSHAWATDIGSLSASNVANPTLTINAPGEGWLYYTATDSNGKAHTAIRHVWAHDPDPESGDYPYTDFELTGLSLSFSGGYRAQVKVSGVADFSTFLDGALVCVWKETWYGDTKVDISLIPGGERELLVGYIVKDSILTDSVHGSVTFEVQTLGDISKSLSMQALSIHAEAILQYWFQMPAWMTLKHMLYWLLYWHSNLLDLADWTITTNTKRKKLFTFNDGNLGSQAMDAASKLVAQIGCNKAGQMFVEENIQFLSAAARAAMDTVMDVTEADWTGQRTIVRRPFPQTSYVEVKGYAFDGTTITPYCAVAPTRIRANRGGKKNYDGLIVSSQADTNFLAGRFLAVDNNPIEEIRISFAGDYSVVDIFPQRWWTTTVGSSDTLRGITLSNIRMVPRTVNLQLNAKEGACLVDAVFEAEAFGPDGIGVSCPSSGSPQAEVSPTWSETPGSSDSPGSSSSALMSVGSLEFLPGQGDTWTAYDGDVSALHGEVDPFWKIKAGTTDPRRFIAWTVGAGGMVRRISGDGIVEGRSVSTSPENDWSDVSPPDVGGLDFIQIVCSRFLQSRHYVAVTGEVGGLWRAWLLLAEDDFLTVSYTTLYEVGNTETRLISIAEDGEDGSLLWLTCWRDDELWLEKWNADTMTREAAESLGAATLAELDANTYVARVAAVPGDKDSVYVYGRMAAPGGLAGTQHVIRSANGGTSFESIEAGWTTDICVALEVVKVSGSNTVYALRQEV